MYKRQDLLSLFYREMEANRGRIRPALTGTEIVKNMEEGKMSALLTKMCIRDS